MWRSAGKHREPHITLSSWSGNPTWSAQLRLRSAAVNPLARSEEPPESSVLLAELVEFGERFLQGTPGLPYVHRRHCGAGRDQR